MPERFDRVIYPLMCRPGIKRDGTKLDGHFYVDGRWVRFRLGRPKKIGGYQEIINGLNGPIRHLCIHSQGVSNYIYCFSGSGIQMVPVDDNGNGGSVYDRTPSGFETGDHYVWTSDTMYDSTGSPGTRIIVHASRSLSNIKSDDATPVYYGSATGTGALGQFATPQSVSGGIVVLQPFLFIFGSNGLIKNSVANDPATFTGGDSNAANVAGTKIVRGLPLRGGGNAPAGLFWSLDSVIRVTHVGGTTKWRYDTISHDTTVLSSSSILEANGICYWIGVDRFFMYNGVVREIPNQFNMDFFFDNLNWDHRQKVWGAVNDRWGEIWWFFPKKPATECNWAVIYNYREECWYDTEIHRSSGRSCRVIHFPIWADSQPNNDAGASKYRLYKHEVDTDHVYGERQVAIHSYIETSDIGFASGGPTGEATQNLNVNSRLTAIEPDFAMSGTMTAQVVGSMSPQGEEIESEPQSFDSDTEILHFSEQRRILRLRFSSNTQGGDYHMGRVLVHMEPGDRRR